MAVSTRSDHSVLQIVVPEASSSPGTECCQTCRPSNICRPTASRVAWQGTTRSVPSLTNRLRPESAQPFTNPVSRRAVKVTSTPTIRAFQRSSMCRVQPVNDDIVFQSVPHTVVATTAATAAAAAAAGVLPTAIASHTSCMSSRSANGAMCRICHDGATLEGLLSPCKCRGTVGLVHQSCLEKWLSTTSTDSCEICGHKYVLLRRQRSFHEWLRHPGEMSDLRNMIGDICCFVLLTPLTAVSAWLCIAGAIHYSSSSPYSSVGGWEAVGLMTLSAFLILVYIIWCLVAIRYHMRVFGDWRLMNQVVTLLTVPVTILCDQKCQLEMELHSPCERQQQQQQQQQQLLDGALCLIPKLNISSVSQLPDGIPCEPANVDEEEMLSSRSRHDNEPFPQIDNPNPVTVGMVSPLVSPRQLPLYRQSPADGHWTFGKLPVTSVSDTVIMSYDNVITQFLC